MVVFVAVAAVRVVGGLGLFGWRSRSSELPVRCVWRNFGLKIAGDGVPATILLDLVRGHRRGDQQRANSGRLVLHCCCTPRVLLLPDAMQTILVAGFW